MSKAKTVRHVNFKDSVLEIPEDAPHIRVYYIAKRMDYLGYGLNLTADVSKPGQYVASGKIPPSHPAIRPTSDILSWDNICPGT